MARAYDMTKRGQAAAETQERVLSAAEELLLEQTLGDVTLQAVADGAGVSVQTVLRHFGSRNGCLSALALRVRDRVEAQRGQLPTGDVPTAIRALVAHYEAEGRLVLRLLGQEAADEWAAAFVRYGRDYHRSWVERFLAGGAPAGSTVVDALVAATDLSIWKLLRLDLGRGEEEVAAVMVLLVTGVEEQP